MFKLVALVLVMMVWMYLTPIFYPVESLPEVVRWCITHLKPMYYYVKQFRDLFYTGVLPQWEYVIRLIKKELMFQEFLAVKNVSFQVKAGEAAWHR